MLKIHLINTRYSHWGKYSGINQFVKYLDPNKYATHISSASDSDEDFPIKNEAIRYRLRKIVQQRGMKWYKLSDLTVELKAFKECWFNKVDVIHYLDAEHSAQFLPLLLSRKRQPKLIATYHQPPELLDTLLDKTVIPKLDLITVVSPEQISYFSKFTSLDKIRCILHGINIDYFKPGNISKEEGKFKCITVGHYLRDFKALRKVAESLSNYSNIEFYVVTSKATELANLANVKVFRGIDDASLLKLYQQSDALFLPLIQSTANNALLEGIACGLPVISTLLPSVKTYLPSQEAILVKDNDPKQLADAILYLAHNQQICKNMGEAARKRAIELDWHMIASQYETLYLEAAQSN
jgi:glycosyltransferase involved in cell wall biosynthesis